MPVFLFDIDGTLINSNGAGQVALVAALADAFDCEPPTGRIPAAGRTDRAITADLFAHYAIEDNDEHRFRMREAYLTRLPDALTQQQGWLLPGIDELLPRLTDRADSQLGLLTGNYRSGAELKLQHFGIDHFFDFGGFGDDDRDRNAVAGRAAGEVRAALGDHIAPGDIWVIGDTPADITCGRSIGATVVAVATGIFSYQQLADAKPDHLFESFASIDDFIGIL